MKSEKIAITLKRSCIGRPSVQKKVVKGLGLNKLRQTVIRKNSPEIRGMVQKIIHMLDVQEVRGKPKK